MHLSFFSVLGFLAVPVLVAACEGECITGTTRKMNDNYNSRVKSALNKIDREIIDTFQLNSQLAPSLTQQIETCYNKISNETLYRALFPGCFHGKCLDENGRKPEGCPNPDCPMICGTPGSMVHFYSKFRNISFATTTTSLVSCANETYPALLKTLQKLVATSLSQPRVETAPGPQILRYRRRGLFDNENETPSPSLIAQKDIGLKLRRILADIPEKLKGCCGGSDLPLCNWGETMKPFILSFP
ncbi:hypothetical protein DFH08DRAFT_403721 [Mycena albidolilacea]|uniref:Uncharacterized protein n=1 Tax=Mycena albidolilacea TaxID=1033008 RepID=A0AAD7F0Z9_9AGAR|nr:hypothetical protein DFH08DRAFT_403721 [Mycena albidolilacea]